jgi:catalase
MTTQPLNTTTHAGISVASDEYSLTVGTAGPNPLQDAYLVHRRVHIFGCQRCRRTGSV